MPVTDRAKPWSSGWSFRHAVPLVMTTSNLPVITIQNRQPRANSTDVAALFGRKHFNVLQAFDRLECSPRFAELNFQVSSYKDSTGRSLRSVDMTKDGFVFLAMGFTGRQAAQFKEAYIERFNELEARLRTVV